MEFIKDWGIIAGFAGLALGTFLYLFRGVISKKIFPQLTKKQSFTILILFMALVWSLSIFSIVIYYVNDPNNNEMQLTVFVTDTKGNIVLENEGRLNIPLGNRSLNEVIGANGRTNFSDITSHNKGDTILIGLEAVGWEIADGKNTFVFTGEPIHLKVKRDNTLGIIKGIVTSKDGQQFIEEALVRINADTSVLTNERGVFKIILPEKMQVIKDTDSYMLRVSKEGYETKSYRYYPESSDADIRLDKIAID